MTYLYVRTLGLLAGRFDEGERGANLAEYALLLALIAIVCFAAVGVLGQATSRPLSGISEPLSR